MMTEDELRDIELLCGVAENGVLRVSSQRLRVRELIAEVRRLQAALDAEAESARMAQDRIERLMKNAPLGAAVRAMPLNTELWHMPMGSWRVSEWQDYWHTSRKGATPEAVLGIEEAGDDTSR